MILFHILRADTIIDVQHTLRRIDIVILGVRALSSERKIKYHVAAAFQSHVFLLSVNAHFYKQQQKNDSLQCVIKFSLYLCM